MEMQRISSGKLCAIGYEPRTRTLRVEFADGSNIDFAGVWDEVWRRLSTTSSACVVWISLNPFRMRRRAQ